MIHKSKTYFFAFTVLLSTLIAGCTSPTSNKSIHSDQGYLDVQGGKIYYQTLGQGDPILVVHGGPGLDQTYLQPQLFELAQNNQVIFYDQLGSGKSTENIDNLKKINLNQSISDLEHLRKKLGLKKVILMGHSFGGLLCMHYAARYPENLKGLILFNSAPANYEGQKAFMDNFYKRTAAIKQDIAPIFSYEEFIKKSAEELTKIHRKLFKVYFHDSSKIKSLNLAFNVDAARIGFKVDQEKLKTIWLVPGLDLLSQLRKIRVQTLIIHGKQDIVPYWTSKEIHSALKGSRLVALDNCGHFPYIEKPDVFKGLVNEFLRQL